MAQEELSDANIGRSPERISLGNIVSVRKSDLERIKRLNVPSTDGSKDPDVLQDGLVNPMYSDEPICTSIQRPNEVATNPLSSASDSSKTPEKAPEPRIITTGIASGFTYVRDALGSWRPKRS